MLNPRLQTFNDDYLDELTLEKVHEFFKQGTLSVKDLVWLYIERIAAFDHGSNGLHAVLEINPDALQIADALEYEKNDIGLRGPLHGIPVLIKDNLATADKMHTSAGSLAMKDSYALEDAFLVKQLREAGAVILGKTNMTEWANFMTDGMPAGFSSRGGQVVNPYGKTFDVGGSSTGSAAAIAANFAMLSIGTETSGSILSPASQHSLVGIKPTVGLLSRTGIIPISITQDTAGPIARTVKDAAIFLNTLVSIDEFDPITKTNPLDELDFTSFLDINGLENKRVGIVREGIFDQMSSEQVNVMEEAINHLKKIGAEVIDPVVIPTQQSPWTVDVMVHEFKVALNTYLNDYTDNSSPNTLKDVIKINQLDPQARLKYGQMVLERAEKTSGTLTEPEYLAALSFDHVQSKEMGIDAALQKHQLDALVYPNNFGAFIPAKAGYPSITVPAGYTSKGEPVGITFTGSAYSEPTLIKFAYAFEQATLHRIPPQHNVGSS
ncbi:amidase family protein [Salipaludibacillus sp. HK11]|uniref:amidase family protein n=1 Tax=Salipaludibacillus sp. HK11 TaxID=3394320 RepID=UPI0039FD2970